MPFGVKVIKISLVLLLHDPIPFVQNVNHMLSRGGLQNLQPIEGKGSITHKMLLNYMDPGIEVWRREFPQKITDVLFAD